MTEQPKKIKIVVKPTGIGVVPTKTKEEPLSNQPTKRKKGLIPKILDIVSNDIRHLPDKLWGERKSVKMPESKESWKDWEDQI